MPQCGLAPGAINICAAGMMKQFDSVNEVLMRVGLYQDLQLMK